MLITTLLNTLVHPHATDNITIEINLKNNYLKNDLIKGFIDVINFLLSISLRIPRKIDEAENGPIVETVPIKRKSSVTPITSKKKKTTKAHIAEVMKTSDSQRLGNIDNCYFNESNKTKTINLAR